MIPTLVIAEDLEDADEQLQEPPDEERVGRPRRVEGLVDVARLRSHDDNVFLTQRNHCRRDSVRRSTSVILNAQ